MKFSSYFNTRHCSLLVDEQVVHHLKSNLTNKMEKLNTNNYSIWSENMKKLLKAHDLLIYIESSHNILRKLISTTNGKRGNRDAMALISSNVEEKYYKNLLDSCETANEMWYVLKSSQPMFFNSFSKEPEDYYSENLSSYNEQFYSKQNHLLQIELTKLREKFENIHKELKEGQEKIISKLPKCQLCNSKVHQAGKCWRLREVVRKKKTPRPPPGCNIF